MLRTFFSQMPLRFLALKNLSVFLHHLAIVSKKRRRPVYGKWFEPRDISYMFGVIVQTKLDTWNAFSRKNNYNSDFIKLNTHKNTEPNETTDSPTPVTTTTIPYIQGTSETINRSYSLTTSCSSQTYLYFTTHTDQRQGQRPASRQTGSGV